MLLTQPKMLRIIHLITIVFDQAIEEDIPSTYTLFEDVYPKPLDSLIVDRSGQPLRLQRLDAPHARQVLWYSQPQMYEFPLALGLS